MCDNVWFFFASVNTLFSNKDKEFDFYNIQEKILICIVENLTTKLLECQKFLEVANVPALPNLKLKIL